MVFTRTPTRFFVIILVFSCFAGASLQLLFFGCLFCALDFLIRLPGFQCLRLGRYYYDIPVRGQKKIVTEIVKKNDQKTLIINKNVLEPKRFPDIERNRQSGGK